MEAQGCSTDPNASEAPMRRALWGEPAASGEPDIR